MAENLPDVHVPVIDIGDPSATELAARLWECTERIVAELTA